MKKNTWISIIAIAVIACGIMALVDGVIRPGYAIKSGIKLCLFFGLPLLAAQADRDLMALGLLRFPRKGVLLAAALGAGVYLVILGGYFLVRPFFDFSGIAESLTANAGVTRENFLLVSLYISFINSLLEEFFFRGFVFTNLKNRKSVPFAYWFSAIVFAAYHVAMMIGWFSPVLFVLVMAGLIAGAMVFNWLNQRMGTICISWLVHMFANFAINTIGFILLNQ